jgi:hypothetical protein
MMKPLVAATVNHEMWSPMPMLTLSFLSSKDKFAEEAGSTSDSILRIKKTF